MPIAPNPSVAQVELRYTQDSQKVENILYFQFPGPMGDEDLDTLCLEVNGWWGATVRPLQPSDVTLREVYSKAMLNGPGPEGNSVDGLPDVGTLLGLPTPNNVTMSVSFRTGLTGRGSRGRNYIIGLVEGDVNKNQIDASTVDAWQSAYEKLLPGGGFITVATWVVYSQYSNNALRNVGVATPVKSVVVVDDTVDSQRRRLPGRGE